MWGGRRLSGMSASLRGCGGGWGECWGGGWRGGWRGGWGSWMRGRFARSLLWSLRSRFRRLCCLRLFFTRLHPALCPFGPLGGGGGLGILLGLRHFFRLFSHTPCRHIQGRLASFRVELKGHFGSLDANSNRVLGRGLGQTKRRGSGELLQIQTLAEVNISRANSLNSYLSTRSKKTNNLPWTGDSTRNKSGAFQGHKRRLPWTGK